MKNLVAIVLLSIAVTGSPASASAQENQLPKQSSPARHETVELNDILDVVSRKSGQVFLIDRRVPADVVVGTARVRDVDYALLLTILRNNGLAAATSDSAVRIVPVNLVRQHELPILHENDDAIPNDEWVTRLIQPSQAAAPRLVPLLRPMVPQAGHLVAESDSNVLIVVAPYCVAKRLVDIVYEIDQRTEHTQASTQ